MQSKSSSIRVPVVKPKIVTGAFLLCVFFVQSTLGQKNYSYVTTKYGEVRGQLSTPIGNPELSYELQVAAFLGIPYAKPPVGELRFLKPQPPDPWNKTLEADAMPPACVQHSQYPFPWYDSEAGQSEDCLYLNVWAPFNISTKRAVKLYIHGGGFSSGSNRMGYYDGQYDAADPFSDTKYSNTAYQSYMGTVDVVINYRLGALGFLTSGTDDAPGNVGLYDMVLALHWVRENIAAFRGDPEKITLVGQGAGAIAISLFTVSPLTVGLFRRAIMTEGNFLTIRKNKIDDNLKLSQRLATAVGCNTFLQGEPQKTVQCLRKINASRLAEELSSFNPTSHYSFYPQYEQDDLIPIDPQIILEYGKLGSTEVFIGYTAEEGSYLLTTLLPDVFGVFGEKDVPLNGTFSKVILTQYLKDKDYPDPKSIADRLLNGTDSEATDRNRRRVYNAMGDENVVCPIVYFTEKFGDRTGSAYLFETTLRATSYNPWAEWMGKVHFNHVQVQFFHAHGPLRVNGGSYNISEKERSVSFYTKVEQTAFMTNGDLQRSKFSTKSPLYSFDIRDKYGILTTQTSSNPSRYNCEVFRPYHKVGG